MRQRFKILENLLVNKWNVGKGQSYMTFLMIGRVHYISVSFFLAYCGFAFYEWSLTDFWFEWSGNWWSTALLTNAYIWIQNGKVNKISNFKIYLILSSEDRSSVSWQARLDIFSLWSKLFFLILSGPQKSVVLHINFQSWALKNLYSDHLTDP